MRFARLHVESLHNFQGLERFRVKMAPCSWEPILPFRMSNDSPR